MQSKQYFMKENPYLKSAKEFVKDVTKALIQNRSVRSAMMNALKFSLLSKATGCI